MNMQLAKTTLNHCDEENQPPNNLLLQHQLIHVSFISSVFSSVFLVSSKQDEDG